MSCSKEKKTQKPGPADNKSAENLLGHPVNVLSISKVLLRTDNMAPLTNLVECPLCSVCDT